MTYYWNRKWVFKVRQYQSVFKLWNLKILRTRVLRFLFQQVECDCDDILMLEFYLNYVTQNSNYLLYLRRMWQYNAGVTFSFVHYLIFSFTQIWTIPNNSFYLYTVFMSWAMGLAYTLRGRPFRHIWITPVVRRRKTSQRDRERTRDDLRDKRSIDTLSRSVL